MPNLEHVSPVMSQAATFEGLGQNPFRIFGLRVDLSSKELTEAIKDLRIQMELGAELPHAFALATLEEGMLAQANQRLRDPVQRICDECFWFWPMDLGAQDDALDLIANGDKAGAKAAWQEFHGHPDWGPIAAHNLAILGLYESGSDSTELGDLGKNALEFMDSVASVNRLKARLRTIDDPRLPRNSARAILDEVRRAMVANQIHIGLDRLAQGDSIRGNRNLRCAKTIADDEELLGSIAEEAFESDFRRLESKADLDIEKAKDADWKGLAQDTQQLIDRLKPFASLASRAEIIGNNAAKTLRSISIYTYNKKAKRKKALQIAEAAYKLASGELLQRIEDDMKTVKEGIEAEDCEATFEPIRLRVEALDDVTDTDRLTSEGRSILETLNTAVDSGKPKKWAEVLYRNLGWLLRGKAIKANNELRDPDAARSLVYLAQNVVKNSESRGMDQNELRLKLTQDAITLAQNAVQPRPTARPVRAAYREHVNEDDAYPPRRFVPPPLYQAPPTQSSGSCLLPFVALLCLTGAAGTAAPLALQTAHTLLKTLLP
jgi:hypothetical protein